MRLGIIATEFPPRRGGMEEMARGLAAELSRHDDVVLYTRRGRGLGDEPYPVRPVLERDLRPDLATLARQAADAWLALNAGWAVAAGRLPAPVFVYAHGNDFLAPFVRRLRPVEAMAVAGLRRTPLLWRWSEPLETELRRGPVRRGLGRAAHVFANSANSKRLLCATHGLAPERVTVVPPGVAARAFQERPPRPPGPLRLLTVSRLESHTPRKNIDGVLEAVARLGGALPVRYTVVGDGDDRPRLEALARRLGLADTVRFAGAVDAAGLCAHYRDADLFVLAAKASDKDVEGFGIVYVEAAAAGLPVIASAEGGALDAVADGITGIVLANSSPSAIADGIRRFARRPDAFRPAVLQTFARRFRWPRVAAQLRSELLARLDSPAVRQCRAELAAEEGALWPG